MYKSSTNQVRNVIELETGIMRVLDVYAGKNALARIKREGFNVDLFDYMLGASGGPKWFVLAGLDRYIVYEFFAGRTKALNIIGSSAGAFRFACFPQHDPVSAVNRLAERYSHTVYSDKPTAKEITGKGIGLLNYVLGKRGAEAIINHPIIKTHFVVAKCKGLTQFEAKPLQMAGLIASACANGVKRKWLARFYQRYVFCSPTSQLSIHDPNNMPVHFVPLSVDNLAQALMASGSIPMVIEGVKDIIGAPKGMYRDGGIIDYHFDLTFGPEKGLILYPHFYSKAIPGWFDKPLKGRVPHTQSYDDVVMLVPSDDFVSRLPHAKIPDRKDFETMPADKRIAYWQEVILQSERLGQAFKAMCEDQTIMEQIKPITFC